MRADASNRRKAHMTLAACLFATVLVVAGLIGIVQPAIGLLGGLFGCMVGTIHADEQRRIGGDT